MNSNARFRTFAILILVSMVAWLGPSEALAKKPPANKKTSAAAKAKAEQSKLKSQAAATAAQLKDAERKKAVAELERNEQQARANDASAKLSAAKASAADARLTAKASAEARKELEQQIEAAAGPDHPVTAARSRYDQTKTKYLAMRARILESPEFREKLVAAKAENRSAAEVAEMQDELLNANPDMLAAEAGYEQSRVEYHRLLKELLAKDPRWQEIVAELKETQRDQTEAEQTATGQASRALTAGKRARDAQQAVAAAAQAVDQQQAKLKSIQRKSGQGAEKKPAAKPKAKKKKK